MPRAVRITVITLRRTSTRAATFLAGVDFYADRGQLHQVTETFDLVFQSTTNAYAVAFWVGRFLGHPGRVGVVHTGTGVLTRERLGPSGVEEETVGVVLRIAANCLSPWARAVLCIALENPTRALALSTIDPVPVALGAIVDKIEYAPRDAEAVEYELFVLEHCGLAACRNGLWCIRNWATGGDA